MTLEQLREELAMAEAQHDAATTLGDRSYWSQRRSDALREIEIQQVLDGLRKAKTAREQRLAAERLALLCNARSSDQVARMEAWMGDTA